MDLLIYSNFPVVFLALNPFLVCPFGMKNQQKKKKKKDSGMLGGINSQIPKFGLKKPTHAGILGLIVGNVNFLVGNFQSPKFFSNY